MKFLNNLNTVGNKARGVLKGVENLSRTAQVLTLVSKHAKEINQELDKIYAK